LGMSRKVTCCTIIKPVLWIPFFFTNQTIMFFGIVFSSVGEYKKVFVVSVPSYKRKCCTFKIQGEITSSAYKYPPNVGKLVFVITYTAIFIRTYGKEEWVLVTFMSQGFWNWTTLNIHIKMARVTSIGEAMTKTAASIARE